VLWSRGIECHGVFPYFPGARSSGRLQDRLCPHPPPEGVPNVPPHFESRGCDRAPSAAVFIPPAPTVTRILGLSHPRLTPNAWTTLTSSVAQFDLYSPFGASSTLILFFFTGVAPSIPELCFFFCQVRQDLPWRRAIFLLSVCPWPRGELPADPPEFFLFFFVSGLHPNMTFLAR